MTKELIICGGDSFAAGDELAGDLIMPGYTSHTYTSRQHNDPQRLAITKTFRETENYLRYADKNAYANYIAECKRRAWPEKLKKYTTADVVNCSRGGISTEEICHRIIETYHLMQKDYDKVTVVMLLTDTFRFGFPMYMKGYGDEFKYQSYTISHGMSPDGIHPRSLQAVYDLFITRTDWDNLWKAFVYVIGCKTYLNSLGVSLILVDSGVWSKSIIDYDGDKQRLENVTNLINIDLKMAVGAVNPALPGFHYVESVHEDFAKRLADYLLQMPANV